MDLCELDLNTLLITELCTFLLLLMQEVAIQGS